MLPNCFLKWFYRCAFCQQCRGFISSTTLGIVSHFNFSYSGGYSVQFSHLVMSDSLLPHGFQHARLPCPSLTPKTCSNSCPLSQWCHPTTSSSVVPFSSCLQSFPALGSSFFFLLINLFFNLRIIALQNFVVFCQTSAWISHRYTYIPSLLNLSPISLPIPPL